MATILCTICTWLPEFWPFLMNIMLFILFKCFFLWIEKQLYSAVAAIFSCIKSPVFVGVMMEYTFVSSGYCCNLLMWQPSMCSTCGIYCELVIVL